MFSLFRKGQRKEVRPQVARRPSLENLEGRNLLSPYVWPSWQYQPYVYPTWMPQVNVWPTWQYQPYTLWR